MAVQHRKRMLSILKSLHYFVLEHYQTLTMSAGQGKFFKHQCTYFHICSRWTTQAHDACGACLSKGRKSLREPGGPAVQTASAIVSTLHQMVV